MCIKGTVSFIPALETRPRSFFYELARMVVAISNFTHSDLFNLLDRWIGGNGCSSGSDVNHCLSDWTLVTWAAEPWNCFFITPWNGWRT